MSLVRDRRLLVALHDPVRLVARQELEGRANCDIHWHPVLFIDGILTAQISFSR